MNLLNELFSFDREETPGMRLHARVYEAFLVGLMLYYAWWWSESIPNIRDVVRPQGVAQYIDIRFMFGPAAYLNAALITVGAILGATRIAPRIGYGVAIAGFHMQYISRYALGEICHASNFAGTAVLGLAASMWIYEEAEDRRRFNVGASYFLLGLGYFSAALSKLIASGPAWVDGKNLWLWIGEKSVDAYSKFGVLDVNWLQRQCLNSRLFATLILCVGLFTELGAIMLWIRKTRPYAAVMCMGMHVGIYFAMNIMFDTSIYHLAVLALPWPAIFDRTLFSVNPRVPLAQTAQ